MEQNEQNEQVKKEELKNNETVKQTEQNQETSKNEDVKPETDVLQEQEPKEDEFEKKQTSEPSVQELLVEIAKLKRKNDKLSTENSHLNKDLRERMSEREIADKDKAEAEAEKQAEFDEMKRTIRIHDLTENYMDLGYSKDLAKKAATAEVDNDLETKFKIQKMVDDAKRKAWEKEFLKNRPDLQAGNGEEQAKDPFMEGFNSVK